MSLPTKFSLQASFRGLSYVVAFTPHRVNHGRAAIPVDLRPLKAHDRRLSIDSALMGRPRLETILHETLHVCFPNIDEGPITQTARDIGRLLWRLGYRPPGP